jgi:hypothetical protein
MSIILFQQLKRKLEDVSRKLESLYDALRESKVHIDSHRLALSSQSDNVWMCQLYKSNSGECGNVVNEVVATGDASVCRI